MSRVCQLSGKRPFVGNKVSHSNIKTKMRQLPNIQSRKIWYAKENRFVKLRVSTRALRTLQKKGLEEYAAKAGLDLSKY